MGREKSEKSFAGLAREYDVSSKTVQSIFEYFTKRKLIQSNQDYEIALRCTMALISNKKSNKAIAFIESSKSLTALFSQLMTGEQTEIVAPESDNTEEEEIRELNHSASEIKTLTETVMNLIDKVNEISDNKLVVQALKANTNEGLRYRIYGMVFKLHDWLGLEIRASTVYKCCTELVKEHGPGPFVAAIESVYEHADMSGKASIYGSSQGVFPLLATYTKKHFKEGKYANPKEVALLFSINLKRIDEIEQPLMPLVAEPEVLTETEKYIQALTSPHSNRRYSFLTQIEYCKLIENSDQYDRNDISIDIDGICEAMNKVRESTEALNLITSKEDTPFLFEEFIREKNSQ